jgi:hypothetical protein
MGKGDKLAMERYIGNGRKELSRERCREVKVYSHSQEWQVGVLCG